MRTGGRRIARIVRGILPIFCEAGIGWLAPPRGNPSLITNDNNKQEYALRGPSDVSNLTDDEGVFKLASDASCPTPHSEHPLPLNCTRFQDNHRNPPVQAMQWSVGIGMH